MYLLLSTILKQFEVFGVHAFYKLDIVSICP